MTDVLVTEEISKHPTRKDERMATKIHGVSVVIVDDEAPIRKMLRRQLTEEGYSVVGEAVDGAEAISLVERLKPDILILDESMPVVGGQQAAPFVRAKSPKTAIVVYSGTIEGAPPWADAFISKPGYMMIGTLLEMLPH
jgi:CheY-like chemotaxis protein